MYEDTSCNVVKTLHNIIEIIKILASRFGMASEFRRYRLEMAGMSRTVAIDIEAYERDRWCVLEIGLAVKNKPFRLRYRLAGEEPPRTTYEYHHLVVEEHIHLRNGSYVADNRDNFEFGRSNIVPLSEATRIVERICGQANSVIFHAARNDLDWLDSIGVDTTSLPRVIDTQDMARELNAPLGLGRLASHLGLESRYPHNAGNDAACTLKVYFALARLEEERDERLEYAQRCPNCSSLDHSVPTTECMNVYFTDWGTMGNAGDEGYDHYLNSL